LSRVSAVAWNVRQRSDRFHARRRAPPLHSALRRFENAGDFSAPNTTRIFTKFGALQTSNVFLGPQIPTGYLKLRLTKSTSTKYIEYCSQFRTFSILLGYCGNPKVSKNDGILDTKNLAMHQIWALIVTSVCSDDVWSGCLWRRQLAWTQCVASICRIHGEFLRLIFFISNTQAEDYFEALGYQPHSQEFCHRRGVFFQQNRGTIGMACAQAVALRGSPTTARRHVAAPRRPPPLHMAYDDHDRNVSHIHGFALDM